jgi:hypothetical protein
MYEESKTITIEKNEDDHQIDEFNVIVCGKFKAPLTRDEALNLLWDLANELDYEVRSKW